VSLAFVAIGRLAVVDEAVEAVKAAFRNRLGLVEEAEGFLRWHHHPMHKASHRLMRWGLKLDRRRIKLTYVEHVTD